MSERNDPKGILIEVIKTLAAQGYDPDKPFTKNVFQPIAEEYGIEDGAVFMSRLMLNVAMAFSAKEKAFQQVNFPKARKQLSRVRRLANDLHLALNELDLETHFILERTTAARRLMPHFDLEALNPFPNSENFATLVPAMIAETNGPHSAHVLLLARLKENLGAVEEYTKVALRMAGVGKMGRRQREHLDVLLHAGFQIWTNFVGEDFTLETHTGGPVSRADRFCADLVAVAFPHTEWREIQTSARRIRESSYKVRNLEEVDAFFDHFSMRSR